MRPSVWPRGNRKLVKLLHIDPERGSTRDRMLADLPELLRSGDLLVVNDAGTLPAALQGVYEGVPIEVRLVGQDIDATAVGDWHAVLFGAGSWRQRTEDRLPPPRVVRGETIRFAAGSSARVLQVSEISPRLVTLRFDRAGAALMTTLFRIGRPIQYSYLCGPLELWHVQTPYAARPWAVEMPSAGWGLGTTLLGALRQRGVAIASLTHAAGLSSTGDPALDAALPLPERFDIPAATVAAVARARAQGGRVVAAGTTVVRALEGCADREGGRLRAGSGVTDLRIGADYRPKVVTGLFTGIHEPGTSHFRLMQAFAPHELLEHSYRHAEASGYLGHEFGDLCIALT